MAKSFNPDAVWAPFGAFSQTVVAGSGRTVYLKGQVALDPDGNIIGEHDMQAQVRQVLENIQTILRTMNGRMGDILSLTQFTTDIQAFMRSGEVRMAYFAEPFPITTTIEVTALYDPRLMIEITAIAEIPVYRFQEPDGALDLHG
ncbi:MAG: RidA family protein [Pseudomonadota bacterium]